MTYDGPPLRREAPVLAMELARLTGLELVAVYSYAEGQTRDPTLVHVAVRGHVGPRIHPGAEPGLLYIDAKGPRDGYAFIRDQYGATFDLRTLSEAGAAVVADLAARGGASDDEAREKARAIAEAWMSPSEEPEPRPSLGR